MTLEQRLLRPFTKAKYLSEENYKRYTAIIHYLYQQHEVYYAPPSLPITILEFIKENDVLGFFGDYDLSKLEADLNMLESWGNVISHQDSGNVSRIEDFNRRKLRYQCTPETIEIERMLEKMNSQINRVKGSLDSNLVNSLSNLMIELETYKAKSYFKKEERKELNLLWNQIFAQFDNLRKDSSDYLGIIHSRNIDDAMQNKEISAFRLKFTEYLTGFIITLQKNVHIIEFSIKEIDKDLIHRVITELILEHKDKPSLGEPITDKEYLEIYMNQWNAMKKWFKYDEYNERFVDYLLKQKSIIIKKSKNATMENICEILKNINPDLNKLFKSEINKNKQGQKIISALKSLNNLRHSFAHGILSEKVYLSDIEKYFTQAVKMIIILDSVIQLFSEEQNTTTQQVG
ncbi:DUF2397 family protein [Niallia sp. FSL W8-0635]|uniref:DUF2397 family protein n=1 Tax=Niallia sp. FSL W8-0635 TaxID=2975337 RepID=UPI0030F746F6